MIIYQHSFLHLPFHLLRSLPQIPTGCLPGTALGTPVPDLSFGPLTKFLNMPPRWLCKNTQPPVCRYKPMRALAQTTCPNMIVAVHIKFPVCSTYLHIAQRYPLHRRDHVSQGTDIMFTKFIRIIANPHFDRASKRQLLEHAHR